MAPKTITLHEIRSVLPEHTKPLGSRRLRTRKRATKLRRYLAKRYGLTTVTHSWRITPTEAEWATLRRQGVK
jgi:hypothetical protein